MFNLPTTNFNHFQELLNDWKATLIVSNTPTMRKHPSLLLA